VTVHSRWVDRRVAVEKIVVASRGGLGLRGLVAVLSVSASLLMTATASAAVVTTGEPMEVTLAGTTFTGTVTDVVPGSTFHFQFWWDSYPQHEEQTTAEPLPPDPEVHVTQEVRGLMSMYKEGLNYTDQLVVEEPGGVVVGQPVSFQTPPTLYGKAPPPSLTCRVRKVTGLWLADARRVLSHTPLCGHMRIVVLPQRGHLLHTRRSYRVVSQSPWAGSRVPWYHSSIFLRVKT
jgi:hypothetical protein